MLKFDQPKSFQKSHKCKIPTPQPNDRLSSFNHTVYAIVSPSSHLHMRKAATPTLNTANMQAQYVRPLRK